MDAGRTARSRDRAGRERDRAVLSVQYCTVLCMTSETLHTALHYTGRLGRPIRICDCPTSRPAPAPVRIRRKRTHASPLPPPLLVATSVC